MIILGLSGWERTSSLQLQVWKVNSCVWRHGEDEKEEVMSQFDPVLDEVEMGSSCKVFEGKVKGLPFFFPLQFYFLMNNDLQCVDVGGTFVSS